MERATSSTKNHGTVPGSVIPVSIFSMCVCYTKTDGTVKAQRRRYDRTEECSLEVLRCVAQVKISKYRSKNLEIDVNGPHVCLVLLTLPWETYLSHFLWST